MPTSEELWLSRRAALGKAQSRYLYLLFVVLGFFLLIDYRFHTDPQFADKPLGISGIGLDLPPAVLLPFGPVSISLLLLAVLGSIRAARHARSELERLFGARPVDESIDPTPNVIDVVVYDVARAPRLARAFAAALYPLVLTLALIAAAYLSYSSALISSPSFASRAVRLSGILLFVPVVWRLFVFWRTRLDGIRAPFS